MIKLDKDGEKFVFENSWDIAIPISVEITNTGESVIECFPRIESVVRRYAENFEADLLSDDALAFLWREIAPFAKKWGYGDDKFRDRWGYIFRCGEKMPQFDTEKAKILYECETLENITTLDIEYCVSCGHAAAAIVEDGKIVSAALTHEPIEELCDSGIGYCEIGVETAPAYRQRHYAATAITVLSDFLRSHGLECEYRCQRYNKASYNTAISAGMKESGRFYSYVLRKNTIGDKNGI